MHLTNEFEHTKKQIGQAQAAVEDRRKTLQSAAAAMSNTAGNSFLAVGFKHGNQRPAFTTVSASLDKCIANVEDRTLSPDHIVYFFMVLKDATTVALHPKDIATVTSFKVDQMKEDTGIRDRIVRHLKDFPWNSDVAVPRE